MKPKLLTIAGPTASGKKRLALAAAERFGGEIVSADSRKIYRLLDIGTAKPSPEDRERVPHHLIDIAGPDEHFSAADWVARAAEAVSGVLARGKLPILSGGTGFYIDAFRTGLTGGIGADSAVRRCLASDLEREGPAAMHERLHAVDPGRAAELHPNDTFRVLRALEAYEATGMTFAEIREASKTTGGDYNHFTIATGMTRDVLYRRIDERVDAMIERGLTDELKDILGRGYARTVPALDTVGYKEWFPWLDGDASFEECREAVKRNTRRYAKRQLTWFRARSGIRWFDMDTPGAENLVMSEIGSWLG